MKGMDQGVQRQTAPKCSVVEDQMSKHQGRCGELRQTFGSQMSHQQWVEAQWSLCGEFSDIFGIEGKLKTATSLNV